MGRTFQEALAKAVAADEAEGDYVTHHRDDVLCRMLGVVGRRARGELPDPTMERQDRETRQILKAQQLARANRMLAERTGSVQAARSGARQGPGSPRGDKVPARVLAKAQPVSRSQQERDDAKLHVISDAAHKTKKPDDAKVLRAAVAALSPEQLAAAVDAAVIAGKISGTEAVALLERVKGKR